MKAAADIFHHSGSLYTPRAICQTASQSGPHKRATLLRDQVSRYKRLLKASLPDQTGIRVVYVRALAVVGL